MKHGIESEMRAVTFEVDNLVVNDMWLFDDDQDMHYPFIFK